MATPITAGDRVRLSDQCAAELNNMATPITAGDRVRLSDQCAAELKRWRGANISQRRFTVQSLIGDVANLVSVSDPDYCMQLIGAQVNLVLDDAAGEFVSKNTSVIRGSESIATARSVTMARRIANALNAYQANDRGK